MTAARQTRAAGAETRRAIIAATEETMLDEGYAAATSRRIAAKAGVAPAVVHYYFPSMDDLFLAVFRRGAEANIERQRRALESARPLRALWELSIDPRGTTLLLEFMALANHRKEIRAEIAAYAERFREAQIAALTLILRGRPADAPHIPPVALAALLAGVSRSLVMEGGLGFRLGHEEAFEVIDEYLRKLEPGDLPTGVGSFPDTPGVIVMSMSKPTDAVMPELGNHERASPGLPPGAAMSSRVVAAGPVAAAWLRPRVAAVTRDPAEAVLFAGGWLFDRAMAGWDVNVLTLDDGNLGPLGILGARVHDLGPALESSLVLGQCLHAIAVPGNLYWSDKGVQRLAHSALQDTPGELLLWGSAADLHSHPGLHLQAGHVMVSVRHRLSFAARAFKAQALAAARIPAAETAVSDAEVFCSVTRT